MLRIFYNICHIKTYFYFYACSNYWWWKDLIQIYKSALIALCMGHSQGQGSMWSGSGLGVRIRARPRAWARARRSRPRATQWLGSGLCWVVSASASRSPGVCEPLCWSHGWRPLPVRGMCMPRASERFSGEPVCHLTRFLYVTSTQVTPANQPYNIKKWWITDRWIGKQSPKSLTVACVRQLAHSC